MKKSAFEYKGATIKDIGQLVRTRILIVEKEMRKCYNTDNKSVQQMI